MKISDYLKHTPSGLENLRCMPSTFIIINNFRNSCKSCLINMCYILYFKFMHKDICMCTKRKY